MSETNATGKTPRIAVVGAGYWGKNLVRNFNALNALACVCDVDADALGKAHQQYNISTTSDYDAVLKNPHIDAVVIAAPAVRHFELTKMALQAGKHVFVEKPLALRVPEGRELVDLANKSSLVLMVGHILEYHPAIIELKRLVHDGQLGKILYIYSSRLNLGKLRTEENILWSFAPHDISVILQILGEVPVRAAAHGGSYLNPPLVDTTLSTLEFASGVKAHVFVSWLHPFKEQKFCVIGSERMAVFDDLEPENKLVLFAHRVNWMNRKPVAERDTGTVIPISQEEPLKRECEQFLECVQKRARPQTDGESGLRVLEVLDACSRSLNDGGTPVSVALESTRYFAHPTAVIDQPCQIGDGTKIWHFSHVMAGSRLGPGCNLGQNVVISPNTTIGNNVKIQNNVSVYTGVELEDDVFCGPSMVFTNVVNPRSHVSRKAEYQRTLVKRGATLGANSTIVCGVTIGQYAFVAAGAVVTRDVPDHALVMGVPARRVGWMCACGIRLAENGLAGTCLACGASYAIEDKRCFALENRRSPSQQESIATKQL